MAITQYPKEWKLYDPTALPMVSSHGFHDSASIKGYPANVFRRSCVNEENVGREYRQWYKVDAESKSIMKYNRGETDN